jgi:RimJ/RimL family protein N-acetyltransferase
MTLALRPATEADFDLYFALQQDLVAVRMAAFTSADLADRGEFDARWRRVLSEEGIVVKTVLVDGVAIGNVMWFAVDGVIEVSYWIARERWGRGYATEALRQLLTEVTERPVFARAAYDNVASQAVLKRNGFVVIGEDSGPAEGRGTILKELVLALRAAPSG